MTTKIQWTEDTWNPVIGCSKVSPDRLDKPLRWRKPRMIFVNSMSDLFHESLSNKQIAAVFGVMAACPQHTFQVLTKRAERMRDWFRMDANRSDRAIPWWLNEAGLAMNYAPFGWRKDVGLKSDVFPLPNVWLGVSCEDQPRADERIPLLRQCPAAVRWVSFEPLLSFIDADRYIFDRQRVIDASTNTPPMFLNEHQASASCPRSLDWAVVGGESCPNARPCDLAWVRSIVRQCREAGVPCFVKHLGSNVTHVPESELTLGPFRFLVKHSKGGDPAEWPEDLRVRKFPDSFRSEYTISDLTK